MARVRRLAGAVIAETEGRYYAVGNTKRPCDWTAAGFESPGELDPLARPYVPLTVTGPVALDGAELVVGLEGEELPKRLAKQLLIERNGSVSERLWALILGGADEEPEGPVAAQWLVDMPLPVWGVVRDSILRCV